MSVFISSEHVEANRIHRDGWLVRFSCRHSTRWPSETTRTRLLPGCCCFFIAAEILLLLRHWSLNLLLFLVTFHHHSQLFLWALTFKHLYFRTLKCRILVLTLLSRNKVLQRVHSSEGQNGWKVVSARSYHRFHWNVQGREWLCVKTFSFFDENNNIPQQGVLPRRVLPLR